MNEIDLVCSILKELSHELVLTPKDKLDYMKEKNENINKLIDTFNLTFA